MWQITFIGICPKCAGARIQFLRGFLCRIFGNRAHFIGRAPFRNPEYTVLQNSR